MSSNARKAAFKIVSERPSESDSEPTGASASVPSGDSASEFVAYESAGKSDAEVASTVGIGSESEVGSAVGIGLESEVSILILILILI